MAVKCSKCGENHEDWVPKDRLDEKNTLIKELKTEIEQNKTNLKDLEPLKAAKAELEKLKGEIAERDAVAAAGFQGDAKAIRRAKALYNVATEDLKEGERPSFGDWLADDKGGRADTALSGYFKAADVGGGAQGGVDNGKGGTPAAGGAASGAGGDAGGKLRPPAPPRVDQNARPGDPPGPKMTAEDVRRYVGSPAFNNLPPDQKMAKLAELQAAVDANPNAGA